MTTIHWKFELLIVTSLLVSKNNFSTMHREYSKSSKNDHCYSIAKSLQRLSVNILST